jgi:hypothetical protein
MGESNPRAPELTELIENFLLRIFIGIIIIPMMG